jgi:hypothetical protein
MTTPKLRKKKVSKVTKMRQNANKCSEITRKNIGNKLLKHILLNIDRATMTPEVAGRQRYFRVHLDGSDVAIVMKERPTVLDRVLTTQYGGVSVHYQLDVALPIVDKNGDPIVEYVGDPAQLNPLSKEEEWLAICNSPLLQCDGYKLTGMVYGDQIKESDNETDT